MFTLNPRLNEDTMFIVDLPLSRVLMSRVKTFPWLILVPRVSGAEELIDLSTSKQVQLLTEIGIASRVLRSEFHPDKLNIGSLGNHVKQLHVHVLARFETDRAWPNAVWGFPDVDFYEDEEEMQVLCERLAKTFTEVGNSQMNLFFPE